MKRTVCLLALLLLLAGCASAAEDTATAPPQTTQAAMVTEAPVPEPTRPARPLPPPLPSPEPAVNLSEEEKQMLLKIGMAERGNAGCTECIALVMQTLLNRVESGRFGSSVRSVLFAPDQFTPVADGSYYGAVPNENCYEALELVLSGWDDSQGALYYEWCEGESWHSKNLHLLHTHCDVRFYD